MCRHRGCGRFPCWAIDMKRNRYFLPGLEGDARGPCLHDGVRRGYDRCELPRRILARDSCQIVPVNFGMPHNLESRREGISGRARGRRQQHDRGIFSRGNGGGTCRYSRGEPFRANLNWPFIALHAAGAYGDIRRSTLGNIGIFRLRANLAIRAGIVKGQSVGKVIPFQAANVLEVQ